MLKIAVLGGTGYVSRYLIAELLKNDFTVRLLTRDGSKSVPGAEIVVGNALDEQDIARLLDGAHAVVNCIGQLKNTADFYCVVTKNVVTCMNRAGIRRYILVTNSTVGFETDIATISTKLGSLFFRWVLPRMVLDKQQEADAVIGSGLEWTIFRLPVVLDGNSSKAAKFHYNRLGGFWVHNRQVAECVVEELVTGAHVRRAPFLFD